MKKLTETEYHVVYKLDKQVYLVYPDVKVYYHTPDVDIKNWEAPSELDDKLTRIDLGFYGGQLIQSKKMLVTQAFLEEKGVEEYISVPDMCCLIRDYFGEEPNMLLYHGRGDKEITSIEIMKAFKQAEDLYLHSKISRNVDTLEDHTIIMQDIVTLPWRFVDGGKIEIYNGDFSIFGIDRYEDAEPGAPDLEVGKIYHYRGKVKVDDIYINGSHHKKIKLLETGDPDWFTITLCENVFPDRDIFDKFGFYGPVEVDLFWSLMMVDTDSIMGMCHLITTTNDILGRLSDGSEGVVMKSEKLYDFRETVDYPTAEYPAIPMLNEAQKFSNAMYGNSIITEAERKCISDIIMQTVKNHSGESWFMIYPALMGIINSTLSIQLAEDSSIESFTGGDDDGTKE